MKKDWGIICLAAVLFSGCFLLMLQHPNLLADEPVHYDEILRIIHGNYEISPWISTLPVYHIIMAIPWLLLNKVPAPSLIRFFTFCTGILAIGIFRGTAKNVDPAAWKRKTFQFAFFPILFPMFFVIYTDVLSLLLILLANYWIECRKYLLAAAAATLAVAVRQNNILWLVFLLGLLLLRERKQRWLRYGWSFLPAVIGFLVFVFLNNGPVVGNRKDHPITVTTGNLFFFLFLLFVFFLPCQISVAPAIHEMLKKKKTWICLAFLFLLYMVTFHASHIYNSDMYSYFLRNRILVFFTSSIALKIVFFLPIGYAFLSLFHTRMIKSEYYFLYPAAAIFLAGSWLIEQRYMLIPFSFFLLYRRQERRSDEYFMAALFVFLSLALFLGIVGQKFFL